MYKQTKACEEQSVFVVEGVKMVEELLRSDVPVKAICATFEWFSHHQNAIPEAVECYEVGAAELERLSLQKSPNAVWALAERPALAPLADSDCPLVLALDHIQDPGNMGTIIRTADWFGIRQVVCSVDTVSCYNPKVVQATMGGIFRTQIHYADLASYLSTCGRAVCGALLHGNNAFTASLPQRAVLVVGNESKGISEHILPLIAQRLTIPNIGGTCESLNASVATGILCSLFIAQQWKNS